MRKNKSDFVPSKMVNWFHPAVLAQSGLKSIVSKMFGNYADRRETQAALDDPLAREAWQENIKKYTEADDIWIDYISDTGDGFNSTYSVAVTAAQPFLNFNHKGEQFRLPRAKIMVLGGDQIYPTPTGDLYKNKFRIPFESALPVEHNPEGQPDLYAIPGNHDWYDGLGNFMKIFCQQRCIGNWKTNQLRSYFAIPLPNNYWLWATDIQLSEDIDKPQQDYFRDIASKKMKIGDKVILCTAEPAWLYKQMHPDDTSYDRLQFFIKTYITEDAGGYIKKTFRLAAILTGDLHHYTHFCPAKQQEALPAEQQKLPIEQEGLPGIKKGLSAEHQKLPVEQKGMPGEEKGLSAVQQDSVKTEGTQAFSNHYICAGGGGAFLHLSHNIPKVLTNLNGPAVVLKKSYPNDQQSKNLLWGNLLFVVHNTIFSVLLGAIYLLFFWLLESRTGTDFSCFSSYISNKDWIEFTQILGLQLVKSPALFLLSVLLIYGFVTFTDTKTGRRGIQFWGLFHGLTQHLAVFLTIYLLCRIQSDLLVGYPIWKHIILATEVFFAGTIIGGSLMGSYLLISDLLFRIHIDESSSSLICEDYKNFLRMHITKDALIIYPIGINKVTKKWAVRKIGHSYLFRGKLPAHHLIEDPIVIKLT